MEGHYLTMQYIIKAVDRPVGATEHFISAVVYCKYCSFERISSYYIYCLPENILPVIYQQNDKHRSIR